MMIHKPVLIREVLQCLDLKSGENVVDCTVGEGGHAALILGKTEPNGKLLGIDADVAQVEHARKNLQGNEARTILVDDSYAHIKKIVQEQGFDPVHGILLDLGYSSRQIEQSGRGFTFMKDEPLDMRYDTAGELTAEKIINEYPEEKLEEIFKIYGEEKFARKIAQRIVQQRGARKIDRTFALKKIIEEVIGRQWGRIHPATRVFQALRIAVNGELGNLKNFLPDALLVLSPGGRLAVISFHSLEDRIVKNFFSDEEKKGTVKILTAKPITAGVGELLKNPRARSAKLRAVIKI